jgi:drug/metabolite transporter (DMT)-like permease
VLVIVWAFVGIAIKHTDTPLVSITAALAAGFVLATPLLGLPLLYRRLQTWPDWYPEAGLRDRW